MHSFSTNHIPQTTPKIVHIISYFHIIGKIEEMGLSVGYLSNVPVSFAASRAQVTAFKVLVPTLSNRKRCVDSPTRLPRLVGHVSNPSISHEFFLHCRERAENARSLRVASVVPYREDYVLK